MYQLKGFSLIEVLASLLLVSTLALALLQHQWQSKQLLNQLLLFANGSQFLDQLDETFITQSVKLPIISPPFQLEIRHTNQATMFELSWFEHSRFITRQHLLIANL